MLADEKGPWIQVVVWVIHLYLIHLLYQVWNLSLLASPTEKLDAARYFETIADHKQYDKAVILYQKVIIIYYVESEKQ